MKRFELVGAALLAVTLCGSVYGAEPTIDAQGGRIIRVAEGVGQFDAVNMYQFQMLERITQLDAIRERRARETGDSETLLSANNYTRAEVGAASAQSKAYADAGDAQTLQSAQTYADEKDVQTLRSANAYTDQSFAAALAVPMAAIDDVRADMDWRFGEVDKRIDRSGAMTAAMVQMTGAAASINTKNRLAIGAGTQNGQNALSVGYQRSIGDRAAVTLGGAFSGDDNSAGVGFGVGW